MPYPRTFFDFTVGDKPVGRVVFELFNDVVPKTAENFRVLCTGEKGVSPISHVPIHYKNCPVHRVIDGFMIQGGDFTKKNGSGGESIWGKPFNDERLEGDGTDVDKKGLLVMANRGPNTNGSQFFITLAPAPHLTGKHVVFGRVIFGMEHIDAIGKLSTDDRDRPLSPVIISHCGELELRRPPPKPRSPSISASISSRSASPDEKRKSKSKSKSKSRRESDMEDSDSDDSRDRRRRRKDRKKDKKDKEKRKDKKPREETEEELDARLEREEKERIEKQRLERLEIMKKQLEDERQKIKDAGGVVYKGRGAMRFLDPETTHRSMPTNFDSRKPDPRARRPPPPHINERRERERNQDRRPETNQRDRLDRDMDKWQHDRSHAHVSDREREKFRRGRSDSLDRQRRPSPSGEKERSPSPIRNGRSVNQKSPSPRMRSESPLRGRTRSRSLGGKSDGSDMVLDAED
ncbi:uncharacterized protein IL334_000710 [Kwoniella shivajii]|uniref:peptidylprolyl isomerase n=1 Tax=Kwoniella shivajii TaxID=564305 RepID=A0ABZ1CRF4_9TREE|nr:hypothetical protein IL334_000710 [Kwoniella shivajii]